MNATIALQMFLVNWIVGMILYWAAILAVSKKTGQTPRIASGFDWRYPRAALIAIAIATMLWEIILIEASIRRYLKCQRR